MRTVFQVLHRPERDAAAAEVLGRFPTLAIAMARTGHPLEVEWEAKRSWLWVCTATPGRTQKWMISEEEEPETDAERVAMATNMALSGAVDGAHHKQWVLDQVVRILTGDRYEQVIRDWEYDGDPDAREKVYEWDTGIAP